MPSTAPTTAGSPGRRRPNAVRAAGHSTTTRSTSTPPTKNRLYSIHTNVSVSEDGGKTFQTLRMRIHVDHHAWYIHPEDPRFIIDGNDGGAAISYDRGRTWRFIENLRWGSSTTSTSTRTHRTASTEVSRTTAPWRGPAYTHERGGIENRNGKKVGEGTDLMCCRTGGRHGSATACRRGQPVPPRHCSRDFQVHPALHPGRCKAPIQLERRIALDPFRLGQTIYYGSQFLHKSTNRGDSWQIISPDLTTNDTTKQRQIESAGSPMMSPRRRTTARFISIAPSPVERGVIWVGTDDGNVQLTTDGGATWSNVTGNIGGVPDSTWGSPDPSVVI